MKKTIKLALALLILTSCASKTRIVTLTTENTSCKKVQMHLTRKEFKELMKIIDEKAIEKNITKHYRYKK